MKQNFYWALVVFAGLIEIVWVSGLKYSSTPLQWTGTVIAIIFSFYLMFLTTLKLPTSTAYAVFVGIGAAGTVITEMITLDEPVSLLKIALLILLIIGIVGLKLAESGQPIKGEADMNNKQASSKEVS